MEELSLDQCEAVEGGRVGMLQLIVQAVIDGAKALSSLDTGEPGSVGMSDLNAA
jgi:hypothetical protein